MATQILFTPGTPILSADVNANFTAINTELATQDSYVNTTSSGTVGAGEDTLRSWTMPVNTGGVNGGIHVTALAFFGANANGKTLRFYVGGSPIILNPTTAAPNNRYAVIDLRVCYQTATSAIVSGSVIFSDRTIETVVAVQLSTAIDWTAAMPLTFSGEGTADNDVLLVNVTMLAFRNTAI